MRTTFIYSEDTNSMLKEANQIVNDVLEERQRNHSNSNDCEVAKLTKKYSNYRFPEEKEDTIDYLKELKESIIPDMVNTASPKFIGHMTSALPVIMPVLSMLIAGLNQNVVKMETSKGLTMLERELIAMMHQVLFQREDSFYEEHAQNKSESLGNLTSDGTVANLTAMWVARNYTFGKDNEFSGTEKDGIYKALNHYKLENAVIIGSEQMHYSFDKAADIQGIGTSNIVKVPCDERGCIKLDKFEEKIKELREKGIGIIAAVGIAGTTNMGSVDPLNEMAEICKKYNIHFHVDSAWGGPVVFSRKYAEQLKGIDKANSITIDAHKQLYVPVGLGMILFKEPFYVKAIEKSAHYIIRKDSYDLGQYSLEGSRSGSCLLMHAAARLIGRRGYEELINQNIELMHFMYTKLRERQDFDVYTEPQLNIMLYRYIPEKYQRQLQERKLDSVELEQINQLNIALQRLQRKKGESFVSRTVVKDKQSNAKAVFLRAVLANPLTTSTDIEEIIEEQSELGKELASRMVI